MLHAGAVIYAVINNCVQRDAVVTCAVTGSYILTMGPPSANVASSSHVNLSNKLNVAIYFDSVM